MRRILESRRVLKRRMTSHCKGRWRGLIRMSDGELSGLMGWSIYIVLSFGHYRLDWTEVDRIRFCKRTRTSSIFNVYSLFISFHFQNLDDGFISGRAVSPSI